MNYSQLEIRWVDLDPTRGAETQKKRPCVILQSTMLNIGSRTLVVAPILPDHKTWPFVVNIIPSQVNGLDKERHINVKQLRVVDISRIENKQGVIEASYLPLIKEALRLVFDLEE